MDREYPTVLSGPAGLPDFEGHENPLVARYGTFWLPSLTTISSSWWSCHRHCFS